MAALKEALDFLTNPTPVFQDPENNEDDTNAKVVGQSGADDHDEDSGQVSNLRRKAALTTADLGEKYAGKRTSRKKLSQYDEADESDNDDGDEETDDSVVDEDGDDIKSFQNKVNMASQSSSSTFSFSGDGDFSKYGDMEEESEGDDDESDDDDDDDDDVDEDDSDDSEVNEVEEIEEDREGVSKFSRADGDGDMERGRAAKAQLGLWDALLENRIKLQKVVGLVNQLPQPDTWGTFEEDSEGGDNFTQKSVSAQASVQNLLDKLLQLQTVLLLQNMETRHTAMATEATAKKVKDDDEITSESESEDKEEEESLKSLIVKVGAKRKLTQEEYPHVLTKRHKDFTSFRNNTIQKWYDRTRLVSGKVSSKSFSSFDQSALKQIEQVLGDKERLVKRTQLKRSVYRVIGQEESADQGETTCDVQPSTDMENSKNYDPEIFDDSDFYHQQLRELIERKAADTDDPVALSRHWLEIQKLRNKVKKKVDTKASKGRRVRYEIHKKLVNFMAPEDRCEWTEGSRDDLFKSLFGQKFQLSATVTERDGHATVSGL